MLDYIVKDVMEVVGYLPIGILCGVLAVVIYLVCAWCDRRKTHLKRHLVWNSVVWFLLVVYLAVMCVTVFLSREPGSRQGIDMTLFGTWGVTPQEHAFVIENILLFVPFGILYPLAVSAGNAGRRGHNGSSEKAILEEHRKAGWERLTILWGFLISAGIETVQLITERGYCQLDDVVMNTLGTVAGYLVFRIVDIFYFQKNTRKRSPKEFPKKL